MNRLLHLVVLCCYPVSLTAQEISHQTLMQYSPADGTVEVVDSVDKWEMRRQSILDGMQQAMGEFRKPDASVPYDMKVLETLAGDGFLRKTITLESGDGDRIPADLYMPEPAPKNKVAAVLALHPTGKLGKRIVAGESTRRNRQYAAELAQRGYIVLAPDYPSFGDYDYDFTADNYVSGTMKGIVNHMRCVDYLSTEIELVDPDRIGVIGHSLGGHNAMFVGVFDERLKAVVSSCGWTPFHDYYGGKLAGWTSDRYMPRLRDIYNLNPDQVPFDFYEVVAALAPRAFMSSSPLDDSNFAVAGVRKAIPKAQEVFDLYSVSDRLQVLYPHCEHDFPTETREKTYSFIDRHLQHTPRKTLSFAEELPRFAALEPDAAMKSFSVADGFELQQTAAEPLVTDPVAMSFDEHGRLFVVEMRDYSEQDTENLGRIRVLEDTDGDGRFDKSKIFAEKLSWPTAVICAEKGIFVGAAPHIYFLKDTDDDLVADEQKIVFTGFGRSNVQGLINSFRWGVDNRIHGATSSSGATVTRPDVPEFEPLVLRRRDFSFDPKKLDMRSETGGAQHGLSFDAFGRKFVCSNSDHAQQIVFNDEYLTFNRSVRPQPPRISIADDGGQAPVFRQSPVEPWRIVRTRLRVSGAVKGVVEGGGKPAGYFTGATGITLYRGHAWPATETPIAIIGDVGSNIIHRKKLHKNGARFIASRIDKSSELVASSDTWFRPVQYANGPDGCLHILDMYRETIEHPKSLPPEIKKHLDLTSGRDRGRLYRLVPEGFSGALGANLGDLSTDELIAALNHPNGWHRETASRILCERADTSAAEPLRNLMSSGSPEAKIHGLYTLRSLNQLNTNDVKPLLADAEPMVIVHALKCLEALSPDVDTLADLITSAPIRTAEVAMQLAFTSRLIPPAERTPILEKILGKHTDKYVTMACLVAAKGTASNLLLNLATTESFAKQSHAAEILSQLGQIVRESEADSISALGTKISELPRSALTDGIAIELGKGSSLPSDSPLRKLITTIIDDSIEIATNDDASAGLRVRGLKRLALVPERTAVGDLSDLLAPTQPPEIQQQALKTLSMSRDREGLGLMLLDNWKSLAPGIRLQAEDLLLGRSEWTTQLISALADKSIQPTDLSLSATNRLLKHKDATIQQEAKSLLAVESRPRHQLITEYQASVSSTGDIVAGRSLFRKHCATCHRLENTGHELGPNLISMQSRGAAAILTNVLDPNREVNPQYQVYNIVTDEGLTINGMIRSETPNTVTVVRAEAKSDTVNRSEIDEIFNSGQSLMPEGFEKVLTPDAMTDLITYLMKVR